jgi:hypothetical protein
MDLSWNVRFGCCKAMFRPSGCRCSRAETISRLCGRRKGKPSCVLPQLPSNSSLHRLPLPPPVPPTTTTEPLHKFQVTHQHTIGSCSGLLIIGNGKVEYQTDHHVDSFEAPLNQISYGQTLVGGFCLQTADGKRRYFFSNPSLKSFNCFSRTDCFGLLPSIPHRNFVLDCGSPRSSSTWPGAPLRIESVSASRRR